jgi:hypothetical protein
VNISNTVIVNNTHITNAYRGRHRDFDYRYGRNPRAVTVVDRDRFVGGRSIEGHHGNLAEADLRRWHRDPRPPAVAPSRDSVFASRVLGRIPGRSITEPGAARLSSGHARSVERSVGRIPFDVERRQIEANGGRPVGRAQLIRPVSRAEGIARASEQSARDNNGSADARLRREDRGRPEQTLQPRTLSDRPTWAVRQREDSQRRRESNRDPRPQSREQGGMGERLRAGDAPNAEARRDWREREVTRETTSGNASSMNSQRRQSPPVESRVTDRPQQWRADEQRERIRTAPEANRASQDNERREWRAPAPADRPRIEQPRIEQPRRVEQPRHVEQPRRMEPPRTPSSQPRTNSNSSRGHDGTRSGNHSGRQGRQQER